MSGDIMGQEAEVGPSAEADVTQAADEYMHGWQARLTGRAVIWGLDAALSVGAGLLAGAQAYLSHQKGDVSTAVAFGIASLAALALGAFAGKKAVDDLRQLEASEHHE